MLNNFFNNKLSFHRCPEIPCGYCVCLILFPCRMEGAILSTNQRTACVARTCWHPFRRFSTPKEEYCGMSTSHHGSVRTTALSMVETRTVPHLCILNRPAPAGRNVPLEGTQYVFSRVNKALPLVFTTLEGNLATLVQQWRHQASRALIESRYPMLSLLDDIIIICCMKGHPRGHPIISCTYKGQPLPLVFATLEGTAALP